MTMLECSGRVRSQRGGGLLRLWKWKMASEETKRREMTSGDIPVYQA